jgi:hypothetical protein
MDKEKTKKVTFSLTATEVEQLEKIAKKTLGKPNKSGMISYWINLNNLKNCKSEGKK